MKEKKQRNKRVLSGLLCAVFLLGLLSGCGGQQDGGSKEGAKEIALAKEKQLNIGYNIKNINIELAITGMNGNAYLRENDYKHYYESMTTENYPIEKLQYYRVEERIRQVWRVKLEFERTNNSKYNEDSFTYFIDTATGEIVGGE